MGEFNEESSSSIVNCEYEVLTKAENEKREEFAHLPPESERIKEMFPDLIRKTLDQSEEKE